MSQMKDLTGQKFGRLRVLSLVDRPKHIRNGTYWMCRCDCGTKKIIWSSSLIQRKTVSCGCLRDENFEKRRMGEGMSALNRLFRQYKRHAYQRNIIFSLSKEDFQSITLKDCFYCGKCPSQIVKSDNNTGDYVYNGVDRVDSLRGYVNKNVVPCCKQCNRAKSDMSIQDFYGWIFSICKRHR